MLREDVDVEDIGSVVTVEVLGILGLNVLLELPSESEFMADEGVDTAVGTGANDAATLFAVICSMILSTFSGLLDLHMIVETPPAHAISAAMSFVSIPPVPRLDPRVSVLASCQYYRERQKSRGERWWRRPTQFSDLHHRFHDFDELGACVPSWVGSIESIHVGEKKKKIGVYHRGGNGGERVVVPKANFLTEDEEKNVSATLNATDADGYCVVFIDYRHLGLTRQDRRCPCPQIMRQGRLFTYYVVRQEFHKRIYGVEVSCSLQWVRYWRTPL